MSETNILEIRWQQRFQNFEKAFNRLVDAIGRISDDQLIQAGIVQTFEFTFELAWKTMKDKLEYEGFSAKTPREVIKQAFQVSYISSPELWLEALDKRNLMSHTYDKEKANEAISLIKDRYFYIIRDIYFFLKNELAGKK